MIGLLRSGSMEHRILQTLVFVGALLFGCAVVLFFKQNTCYAQSTYYGPTSPVPGLIKVEIQIYDDPELGGAKIEEVLFHNQQISLKPPGVHGYRGGGSFQLEPGSYDLIWRVSSSTIAWPRTVKHQQKVQVGTRDVWVQITIHGNSAAVI